MNTFFAAIATLALTATLNFAHLGETQSDCQGRYGKPVFTNKQFRNYEKDGNVIAVTFDLAQPDGAGDASSNRELRGHQTPVEARAIGVIYTKKQDHTYFSNEEFQALLAANAGPDTPPPGVETWKPVRSTRSREDYLRFDNLASARVYRKYVKGSDLVRKVRIQQGIHLLSEKDEE
jgi:hypothetical protein